MNAVHPISVRTSDFCTLDQLLQQHVGLMQCVGVELLFIGTYFPPKIRCPPTKIHGVQYRRNAVWMSVTALSDDQVNPSVPQRPTAKVTRLYWFLKFCARVLYKTKKGLEQVWVSWKSCRKSYTLFKGVNQCSLASSNSGRTARSCPHNVLHDSAFCADQCNENQMLLSSVNLFTFVLSSCTAGFLWN